VFSKYVAHEILQRYPSDDSTRARLLSNDGQDLIDHLKSGIILGKLITALARTDIPQVRLEVEPKKGESIIHALARLKPILDFISKQEVKFTCSADDLYKGNEVQVMGLVWLLCATNTPNNRKIRNDRKICQTLQTVTKQLYPLHHNSQT